MQTNQSKPDWIIKTEAFIKRHSTITCEGMKDESGVCLNNDEGSRVGADANEFDLMNDMMNRTTDTTNPPSNQEPFKLPELLE